MSKSLPDALDLPTPELVEAEGEAKVDSLKLLNGGHVRFCFDGMQSTDLINLNWPLAVSGYPPIPPQNGVEAGCIEFYIPPQYIALWLDNFAIFSCTVTRNGEDQTSPDGMVGISLPSNLPQVQILEAIDKKLDLSLLCCNDPTIHIPPWAFAGTIQKISCYIGGIYPDGSKARLYPFEEEPVTVEDVRNGWTRVIPVEQFRQLKHASELFVLASAKFSNATPYRSFPSQLLTLFTEPHLDPLPPKLREAVETEFGDWVVNPTNTVDGAHIVVAYEGICSKDLVCPTFSGTPGEGSPPLECRTVGEGANSVVVLVPPSAMSANFNKSIKLAYKVTRCDGSQWSSPEQTVKVLDFTGGTKPYIEQVTGRVLDLGTFNDDATVVVPIWDYAAVGQCVWVWITGTLEGGSAYQFFILMDEPLTQDWLTNGVDAPIARAELQKLEDCSDFELHAAVSFDGKCDLATAFEFPVQMYNIEQEDLVLDAPDVLEAVGKQLTIYNARNGMTVRVAYTGISDKHQIQLNVKRADGTSIPLLPLAGDSNRGYVDFPIDRTEVIHASGKTLTINYTVRSACKLQTSEDLGLEVSVPVRLTTPEVAQATPPATQGGILDLRTFAGDARIFVPRWWFMLSGQRCWLECSGKLWDGSIYTFKVMDAELVTTADDVANELSRVLKRNELETYDTCTKLTFVFKLTADGGTDVTKAIVFPVLELILRKRLLDETPFDPNGRDWNGWQRGAGATHPSDLRRDYGSYPWGNGYWLTNWGYTDTSNPGTQSEILFRVFNNLEPGRLYRFHAWVRDDNGVPNPPLLVLRANGVDITPVVAPDTTWYLLEGAFTPSAATVRLSFNNLRMGAGPGNDFRVTWLRVYEV